MPAFMKVSRDTAQLSFCQTMASAQPMGNFHWFFLAAAKYWFLQLGPRMSSRSEPIDLPRNVAKDGRTAAGVFNDAKACGAVARHRNSLISLCTALMVVMSYAVAGAQTTTTLSATPRSAANGSVFAMTAQVKA